MCVTLPELSKFSFGNEIEATETIAAPWMGCWYIAGYLPVFYQVAQRFAKYLFILVGR